MSSKNIDLIAFNETRLFADDTNLTVSGVSITSLEAAVNSDLKNPRKWLIANKRRLNVAKGKTL